MGRFDYPSPYWDSVGDPALDLIDRMLTVDVEKRITIDECLEHPWLTGRVGDKEKDDITKKSSGHSFESTDGLTGALCNLDFSSRKLHRERTLLSAINDVQITNTIPASQKDDKPDTKVFVKNPGVKKVDTKTNLNNPASGRDAEEFAQMGGKGDQVLFADKTGSIYQDQSMIAAPDTK